jgi:hypothetical protein
MGWIRGKIPNETDVLFRKIAMKKFGYRKGCLSQALQEAICQWIKSNKTKGEI